MPKRCRNCGKRARTITKLYKNIKKNTQYFITSCLECKESIDLDPVSLSDLKPFDKKED